MQREPKEAEAGLIICPMLEPGRSGVGDYAVQLAIALRELGHSSRMVAIHDSGVTEKITDSREGIPILRLPAHQPWRQRLRETLAWAHDSPAAWVSAQLVLYGYHSKGLPWHLPNLLEALATGKKTQVMIHETWLGGGIDASLKERTYGALQRALMGKTLRAIKPKAVHTHAFPYEKQLRKLGFKPDCLPLFSNFPVSSKPEKDWLGQRLPDAGKIDRAGRCHFGVFGTLHPEWNLPARLSQIKAQMTAENKIGVIISFGHAGAEGERQWQEWSRLSDDIIQFYQLGALPAEEVSQCLHDLDYGLSATPPDLIEKSAAAAAMFAHGLPVLADRQPVFGIDMAQAVAKRCPLLVWGEDLERFHERKKQKQNDLRLKIAAQLIAALN